MLTITQLFSNGARVWFNRHELRWPLIGWFAVGAVPAAIVGAFLLTHAPLAPLQRVLGLFLIATVSGGTYDPTHAAHRPGLRRDRRRSGLGSALLGSVGPFTAPFFLAAGLTRAAYIGTEAASALTLHLTKLGAYGAGRTPDHPSSGRSGWRSPRPPCSAPGSARRSSTRSATTSSSSLVEVGLIAAGVLFLIGI